MGQKKPFHEVVAEKLIEQLKAGTAPWQRPWEPGNSLPVNPTTGNRYKGINAIQLMSENREDNRWLTYKQASAIGAQVLKGEKGTPVQYWKFSEEQVKRDDNGRPIVDDNGQVIKQTVKLERPRVFMATVFNAQQIDGMPSLDIKDKTIKWNTLTRAENILKASGANISNSDSDRAFYRYSTDSIHLPEKHQFDSPDKYYATALHELGHWTGHSSRLDRDLSHPFGSQAYAKEELRAEIASMIMGEELNIGHDSEQHAAYVGSWIQALQDDPLEIFRAASDAEKIQEYVFSLESKQILDYFPSLENQKMEVPTVITRNNTDENPNELKVQRLASDSSSNEKAGWYQVVSSEGEDISIPFENESDALEERQRLMAEDRFVQGFKSKQFDDFLNSDSTLAFGVEVPHNWNGVVELRGNTELVDDSGNVSVVPASQLPGDPYYGVPQFYSLYAQLEDGTHALLEDYDELNQAEQVKERLSLAAANIEENELERSAMIARVHEESVRRDPNSTDEDILAAKELRKDAEMAAMLNDEELQKNIREDELSRSTAQQQDQNTYINVPYKEKDEAKALGAKWDRKEQSWYVPVNTDLAPFAKWQNTGAEIKGDSVEVNIQPKSDKTYLAVPYGERELAKSAGALWDKAAKSWYVGPNADMEKLNRWLPDNVPNQQVPAVTPVEEFADALRSMGCIVKEEHPIMDGKKHRISAEGDKAGEKAGFYIGHLDGHPAGYIKNNRTGLDMKWKSKGYSLSDEEKAKLTATAASKLAARAEELQNAQNATAQRIEAQMRSLGPITASTPYLDNKDVKVHFGALTDNEGKTTFIPAQDVEGRIWTMQYINEDGTKRFAKDSKKEGCFHVVGGMEALEAAPALVVGEGYATAATSSEALGFATVAAFDSSNLPHVVKALHEKYPDKPVIVVGDEDRHLEMTQGSNPGRSKAETAAKEVGGKAIFPVFTPKEQEYPATLAPVTPDKYRKKDLTEDQLSALNQIKRFTDFNDMASKSELGKEGVERQLKSAVSLALKKPHMVGEIKTINNNQEQQHTKKRSAKIG